MSHSWTKRLLILGVYIPIYPRRYAPVDSLSSEDVAVVVDFHWFTDCHLEAIFNMNTSRLQLRSPTTVDGKDVRLITCVSPWTQHDILPHRQSQLSDLTIRLHITTSLKSISQKRWLSHQFSSINLSINNQCHVTNRSLSSLVKIAFSWKFRYDNIISM